MRALLVLIVSAAAALALGACGSKSVSVPAADAVAYQGAEIFAQRCSGCHTISAAGTQGSGNRALRAQGPNFDQRVESYDDVLFALHNGGFSGAIMPQNIVVGDDATKVAEFLAKYSGSDVEDSARPLPSAGSEGGEAQASPDDVGSAQSTEEGAVAGSGGSGSESGSRGSGSRGSQGSGGSG